MALILCSECGREFSDKAEACPNCGCPTDIIIQENKKYEVIKMQEEKAAEKAAQEEKDKEEIRRSERKLEYAKIYEFKFKNSTYKFDGNMRICAKLGARLCVIKSMLYDDYISDIDKEDPISLYPNNFNEYATRLTKFIISKYSNVILEMFDDFGYNHNIECILEVMGTAIEREGLYTKIINVYRILNDEYSITRENIRLNPMDKSDAINLISFASEYTMHGTVSKRIADTSLEVYRNKRKERISIDWREQIVDVSLACNMAIISIFECLNNFCFEISRGLLLSQLENNGEIFKKYYYPLGSYTQNGFFNVMESGIEEEGKIEIALTAINDNPGEALVYAAIVAQIKLSQDSKLELLKLIQYFEVQEQVKSYLGELEIESELEGLDDICKQILPDSKMLNDGIVFGSKEDDEDDEIDNPKRFISGIENVRISNIESIGKCSKCGEILNKSVKFCSFCGAPNQLLFKDCPSCGKKIISNVKFCNFCGIKLI